jgi:mannose-6-phosphate isomerase
MYGLDLPPDAPIGEALATAGEAVISAGDGEGRTLQDLIEDDPRGRLGARARGAVSDRNIFPLLVKLIDAAENLSIQVHPDDAGARALDRLGKTEAWYVLDAEPGAKLYLGLKDDVSLDEFMTQARKLDGSSEDALRAVIAEPGMTILIPAGTIHALGAGVMVYEIQQPSDVTFRLDDWGRTDAEGNPREMHLEQGSGASRAELRPAQIVPVDVGSGEVERQLLTACRYFALERIRVPAGASVAVGASESPEVLTALSGSGQLCSDTDEVTLTSGSSGVVWPADEPATLVASDTCEVLRAWVPDLRQDIIQPARTAGANDDVIAGLGGASADIRDALTS